MMDARTLQSFADKFGIDRVTVLREYLQAIFINELYALPGSEKLIFKGGTSLRLMHGSNRFSEDLDFTAEVNGENIRRLSDAAVVEMGKIVTGVNIEDVKSPAGISRRIVMKPEFINQNLVIKLDFSLRELVVRAKKGVIQTQLPVVSSRLVTYLDEAEVLSEKVRAVINREKGRDIYDMWYLLNRGVDFDINLVQKKLDFYKEKFDSGKLLQRISLWNEKELNEDVRRFLPVKDRAIVPELKRLLLDQLNLKLPHD